MIPALHCGFHCGFRSPNCGFHCGFHCGFNRLQIAVSIAVSVAVCIAVSFDRICQGISDVQESAAAFCAGFARGLRSICAALAFEPLEPLNSAVEPKAVGVGVVCATRTTQQSFSFQNLRPWKFKTHFRTARGAW